MSNIGVHQNHCCVVHGCKYGDEDCPVVSRDVVQSYSCEDCLDWQKPWKNINIDVSAQEFNELYKQRCRVFFMPEGVVEIGQTINFRKTLNNSMLTGEEILMFVSHIKHHPGLSGIDIISLYIGYE